MKMEHVVDFSNSGARSPSPSSTDLVSDIGRLKETIVISQEHPQWVSETVIEHK